MRSHNELLLSNSMPLIFLPIGPPSANQLYLNDRKVAAILGRTLNLFQLLADEKIASRQSFHLFGLNHREEILWGEGALHLFNAQQLKKGYLNATLGASRRQRRRGGWIW